MEKETKQKLRRLWRNRLLVSLGIIAVSGFSVIQVQALISNGIQLRFLEAKEANAQKALLQAQARFQKALAQFQKAQEAPEAQAQIQTRFQKAQEAQAQAQYQALQAQYQALRAQDALALQAKAKQNRAMLSLLLSLPILAILLFVMMRFRTPSNISFETQFIIFFPEECIAELGVLIRRMKKEKASPWEIRLCLLQEVLTLFWAFYIQIQLDNLRLPSGKNKIDE